MKTYLLNTGASDMFCFDDTNKTVNCVMAYNDHVRRVIPIMEDGILKVSEEDMRNVSKGDIVVLFWKNDKYMKNSVIIIKSTEWFENILAEIEFENKRNIILDEYNSACCDNAE